MRTLSATTNFAAYLDDQRLDSHGESIFRDVWFSDWTSYRQEEEKTLQALPTDGQKLHPQRKGKPASTLSRHWPASIFDQLYAYDGRIWAAYSKKNNLLGAHFSEVRLWSTYLPDGADQKKGVYGV